MQSHPEAAQLVAEVDQAWMKQLEEVTRKGIRAGRFRSVKAKLVAAVVERHRSVSGIRRFDSRSGGIRTLGEEFLDLIVGGLTRDG